MYISQHIPTHPNTSQHNMAKQMVVTRASLAAGSHPKVVMDAIHILMEEPIPTMSSCEGICEIARRDKIIVDPVKNLTVVDVMYKFNVLNCTDTKEDSDYDEDEIDAMDKSLEALFDMLSKSSSSYKVAILPGSYSDEYPAVKLDVFVNSIQRCDKRKDHILRARTHLLKFCADDMLFAVYKKTDNGYDLTVYQPMSPTDLMYPDMNVEEGILNQEKNKFVIETVINRWAPMNHMITMVGCKKNEDDNDAYDEDSDEDFEDNDS